MPSQAFADDFKFITNLIMHSKEDVQAVVNIVTAWVDVYSTPLSIKKCFVVHCGRRQLKHEYHLNFLRIKCVDSTYDLGVMRSRNGACSEHCNAVISKATEACGMSFVPGIVNFCGRPSRITCSLFCHTVLQLEIHFLNMMLLQ